MSIWILYNYILMLIKNVKSVYFSRFSQLLKKLARGNKNIEINFILSDVDGSDRNGE